jgi:nucleoside-diphosphate-sugar epimerase
MGILVSVIGSEGGLGRALCKVLAKTYAVRRVDIRVPNEPGVLRGDVRSQEDMERAVDGAGVVVHLAAFHGGYVPPPTDETRFDVNVVGTFRVMQACLKKNIRRVVWGSSLAALSKHGLYSISKVIGEDLCEYYHVTHKFQSPMLRYGAFTPCDLVSYGGRLLGVGVDLRDVAGATARAVDILAAGEPLHGPFTVMPDHGLRAEDAADFGRRWLNLLGQEDSAYVGLVKKYEIRMPNAIQQHDLAATRDVLGFAPGWNFLTFLKELKQRDARGEVTPQSPRWAFECGTPAPEGIVWPASNAE